VFEMKCDKCRMYKKGLIQGHFDAHMDILLAFEKSKKKKIFGMKQIRMILLKVYNKNDGKQAESKKVGVSLS